MIDQHKDYMQKKNKNMSGNNSARNSKSFHAGILQLSKKMETKRKSRQSSKANTAGF